MESREGDGENGGRIRGMEEMEVEGMAMKGMEMENLEMRWRI